MSALLPLVVQQIELPEEYRSTPEEGHQRWDIALIVLDSPVTSVKPVQLAAEDQVGDGFCLRHSSAEPAHFLGGVFWEHRPKTGLAALDLHMLALLASAAVLDPNRWLSLRVQKIGAWRALAVTGFGYYDPSKPTEVSAQLRCAQKDDQSR